MIARQASESAGATCRPRRPRRAPHGRKQTEARATRVASAPPARRATARFCPPFPSPPRPAIAQSGASGGRPSLSFMAAEQKGARRRRSARRRLAPPPPRALLPRAPARVPCRTRPTPHLELLRLLFDDVLLGDARALCDDRLARACGAKGVALARRGAVAAGFRRVGRARLQVQAGALRHVERRGRVGGGDEAARGVGAREGGRQKGAGVACAACPLFRRAILRWRRSIPSGGKKPSFARARCGQSRFVGPGCTNPTRR